MDWDKYKPRYSGEWLWDVFAATGPLVALLLLVGLLLWLFLKWQKAHQKARTIYIPLRNEGTSVVRPTLGIKVASNAYQVLPTKDYDPAVEEWVFPPGSLVACSAVRRNNHKVLVATRKARPKSPLP